MTEQEIVTDNPLVKIALGLLMLAGMSFKNISLVNNSIIAGGAEIGTFNAQTMIRYGWVFDEELNAWKYDLTQLEE